MYQCKQWTPHLTVATVVEHEGKFLMVEEHSAGRLVLNQPSGHIERGESIIEAAIRETKEETAYEVQPTHLIRLNQWHKPHSHDTFFRYTLCARVIKHHADSPLDDGIERALWMSYNEVVQQRTRLRSPLVEPSIRDYLSGLRAPLSLFDTRLD